MSRLCNLIQTIKYRGQKDSPVWRSLFLLFVVFVFFAGADFAYAGFGISPPYVRNERLTRGSTYEQRILLVRSDPVDDLQVDVTINIPEAESWLSVDRGKKFILPKGETQLPIVIRVDVPDDAVYKNYRGAIRVRTSAVAPEDGSAPAGVSIALGAQIDIDLKVVDKIFDFEVRKIRVGDSEEGRTKWGLFFPGRIKFFVTIENTGNTQYGPTRVKFDIYDSEVETLLETTYNTNKIEKIAPFAIQEVLAELPTRLPAGRYVVKYAIYKGEEIAQSNQFNLSVLAAGAVEGYEGYGFSGLSTQDKIKVVLIFVVPLVVLIILIATILLRRKRSGMSPRSNFNDGV